MKINPYLVVYCRQWPIVTRLTRLRQCPVDSERSNFIALNISSALCENRNKRN